MQLVSVARPRISVGAARLLVFEIHALRVASSGDQHAKSCAVNIWICISFGTDASVVFRVVSLVVLQIASVDARPMGDLVGIKSFSPGSRQSAVVQNI